MKNLLLGSLMFIGGCSGCSGCSGSSGSGPQMAPELSSKLDSMLSQHHQAEKLAGLSVAVLKDGTPLYKRHWGGSTGETTYNIASVTKPFTSAAVLKLRDAGKLSLADTVSKHLKNSPAAWKDVTIHQLLTHMSGIPDYTKFTNFVQEYGQDFTLDEVLTKASGYPLEFKPGAKFSYSNTGYVVLGHIIAKASGIEYASYMARELFKPLGMKNAFIATAGSPKDGVAPPRDVGGPAPYVSPNWSFSAGALMASLEDFCAFDKAIVSGQLPFLQEAWKPVVEVEGKPFRYGLGWLITSVGGKEMVLHFGDKPGYSACYAHFPGSKLSIVVLANRTNANTFGIAQKVFETVKSLN